MSNECTEWVPGRTFWLSCGKCGKDRSAHSTGPVTASTPPLVDVIAEVLGGHQWYDATTDSEDPATGCTGCEDWFGDENAVDDGTFAAHQARAVLDALTKAGSVEWGIRYGDGDIDEGYLDQSAAQSDIARLRERVRRGYDSADEHEPMTLLTRRRFEHTGPWAAVEG